MGKSKKKKSRDFQKVKLKVGRRLKPADNVTNASFHTRTIQISQQLKGTTTAPSTKRKLNITDLLSQCQHYNITVRHDALTGLRELLTSYPELLTSHLAIILERTSELFADKDPVVRQAVIRLLKQVFANTSAKQIRPFFPIFSAHLSCAMTHIYDDIQLDSLSVFDLILESFPDLIVGSSNQLLQNFVAQISQKHHTGSGETVSRSLLVNPGRKISAQKWRIKVLERLNQLLAAMTSLKSKEESEKELRDKHDEGMVKWLDGSKLQYQPFPECFRKCWVAPGLTLSSNKTSAMESGGGILSDVEQLQNFVKTLIPLLIDSWLECAPSSTSGSAVILSADAVRARLHIAHVIQLMCRCVELHGKEQMSWFVEQYGRDFQAHLLLYFPYSMHDAVLHKVKKDRQKKQVSVTPLNVAVCDVMSYFLPSSTRELSSPPWFTPVSEYLGSMMQGRQLHGQPVSQHSKVMVKILQRLVASHMEEEILANLLSEALGRFLKASIASSEKKHIFALFSNIILDPQLETTVRKDILDQFLSSLPELLTLVVKDNQQMAAQVLSIMKAAACQTCTSFLQALSENLTKLLDSRLFITLEELQQRPLVDLLFFIPELTEDHLKQLTELTRLEHLSTKMVTCVIEVLQYRFLKQQRFSPNAMCQHLGFLITVLLGCSASELSLWKQEQTTPVCMGGFTLFQETPGNWARTYTIVQTVCSCLQQLPNPEQMTDIITSFMESLLDVNTTLSITAAFGVIHMANSLEFWKQIDSEKLSSDLSRLCTSVLHCTVTLEMDPQQVVPGQDEPVVSAKGRLDQKVSTNENKELEVSTNDNKELEVPANENKELGDSTNDNIELEVPANQRRGVAPPDFVTIACMKCLSCLPGGIPGLFDVLMDTVKAARNEEEVFKVARIVYKLITVTSEEILYLHSQLQSLSHNLVSFTEAKFPGAIKHKWWSELQYIVDL